MGYVIENLRLKELIAIVRMNQAFYNEFVAFLDSNGYPTVHAFIDEKNNSKALSLLEEYLKSTITADLYDGMGRPYSKNIAKWYFLAWVLRDAPAQRLGPILSSIKGETVEKKKAFLLNKIRKFVGPLFPEAEKWSWPVISEVMLARLEGSRRALKGVYFEEVVRSLLTGLFSEAGIPLKVGRGQVRIDDETYDVQILSKNKSVLVPVKTRETTGGGHAMLFTRDIFKSISVAHKGGYECIPVVIAESWGGDLKSLDCEHVIYIKANPNQADAVIPVLQKQFASLLPFWKKLSEV
jgi:hypothetical protein